MPSPRDANPDSARSVPAVRFPATFLTIGALATIAAVVWLTASYIEGTGENLATGNRISRLAELRREILHYDEVLTMSARMAATTGDLEWEARYRRYEPRLDQAIVAIAELAGERAHTAIKQTDDANRQLVAMENEAFHLVADDRSDEARDLLFSARYAEQKTIYSDGMNTVAHQVLVRANELHTAAADRARTWIVTSGVVLVLLVVAWVSVLRAMNRWRRTLSGFNVRIAASEERFRTVVQHSPDAVVSITSGGRIAYWNDGATTTFGWSAHEASALTASALFMPTGGATSHIAAVLDSVVSGRAPDPTDQRFECIGVHKSGGTFPADVSLSTWSSGATRLVTASVRDLTERRELERAVVDASVAEQRRLGEVLHDGLGQHLLGTGFRARALAARLAKGDRPEADDANHITDLIKQAMEWNRSLAHGLAPVGVEGGELPEALSGLAGNTARVFGVACDYDGPAQPLSVPRSVATHLYGIAHESITNAIKHSGATHLRIRLAATDHQLSLSVSDNGSGLPSAAMSGPGLGLRLIRFRANLLDGTVDFGESTDGGTLVTCTCPLVPADPAHGAPAGTAVANDATDAGDTTDATDTRDNTLDGVEADAQGPVGR